MDRSRGALEVWIATAKPRLVGWMTNHAPFDHSRRSITIERGVGSLSGHGEDLEYDWDGSVTIERVTLKTTRRCQDIDHALVIAGGSRGPTEKNIPVGAKHEYIEIGNKDRYSWRVLMLDMDDYDWVFDLDTFEPFDRAPNVDEDGREVPDEDATFRRYGAPVRSEREPRNVRDILRDHLATPKLTISGDMIVDGSLTASTLSAFSISERHLAEDKSHLLDALSYTAKIEHERSLAKAIRHMETSITNTMLYGDLKSPGWKDFS